MARRCRGAAEAGKAKGGKKKKRPSSEVGTDEEALAELLADNPELGLDPAGVAAVDDVRDPEVRTLATVLDSLLVSRGFCEGL